MTILETSGLKRQFGNLTAVDNLNLAAVDFAELAEAAGREVGAGRNALR